jgi:hypothetical protein
MQAAASSVGTMATSTTAKAKSKLPWSLKDRCRCRFLEENGTWQHRFPTMQL